MMLFLIDRRFERDAKSRSIVESLQSAGHTVKWIDHEDAMTVCLVVPDHLQADDVPHGLCVATADLTALGQFAGGDSCE